MEFAEDAVNDYFGSENSPGLRPLFAVFAGLHPVFQFRIFNFFIGHHNEKSADLF